MKKFFSILAVCAVFAIAACNSGTTEVKTGDTTVVAPAAPAPMDTMKAPMDTMKNDTMKH